MTRPTTLNFEEAAFTMQWHENRQLIHKQVYDILLEGKMIPEDQKTRPFVYDVTLLDRASRLALVTARGLKLGNGIQSEQVSRTVRTGDTLTIRTRLSAVKRLTLSVPGAPVTAEKPKVQETLIQAHDVGSWATELLARFGMAASDIKLLDYQHRQVSKHNRRFRINEAYLEARVTIESTPDFIKAYLNGMGRHKGYGYGFLEVVS